MVIWRTLISARLGLVLVQEHQARQYAFANQMSLTKPCALE